MTEVIVSSEAFVCSKGSKENGWPKTMAGQRQRLGEEKGCIGRLSRIGVLSNHVYTDNGVV
jgi:hypothetical protein